MDNGVTAAPDSDDALRSLQARLALTERALADEQARRIYYEQILANVNDAIIIIDAKYQI